MFWITNRHELRDTLGNELLQCVSVHSLCTQRKSPLEADYVINQLIPLCLREGGAFNTSLSLLKLQPAYFTERCAKSKTYKLLNRTEQLCKPSTQVLTRVRLWLYSRVGRTWRQVLQGSCPLYRLGLVVKPAVRAATRQITEQSPFLKHWILSILVEASVANRIKLTSIK